MTAIVHEALFAIVFVLALCVLALRRNHLDAQHRLDELEDTIDALLAGGLEVATADNTEDQADVDARPWHDPTHGRIDRDIQEYVAAMHPTGIGQRVAIENTLQYRRDHGHEVVSGSVAEDG